jgi:formate hydrogenlyase transcriptional activator
VKKAPVASSNIQTTSSTIEIAESFRNVLDHNHRLEEAKRHLEEELNSAQGYGHIVGKSEELRTALMQADAIAPLDRAVLITGEPGTGKELIARTIHALSRRNRELFVKVSCISHPAATLERTLFGYDKQETAPSGPPKMGRIELAHMGSLFIEEIGKVPLDIQPRLLRTLRDKQVSHPRGATRKADVRLIASTHCDLAKMVAAGRFNADLYRYLTAFPIKLLPLRMRTMDIPDLVTHFVSKHARQLGKQVPAIPREVMDVLCAAPWPLNIRELDTFIERAVTMTEGSTLRAPLGALEDPLDESLHAAERRHILRVLRDTKGIIGGRGGAASRLGVKRTTLNSKLKKLGIDRTHI